MIPGMRVLAMVLPCVTLGASAKDQTPVPMRDVTIRGSAAGSPQGGTVSLVVRATIGTPLGRIPINSYMRLSYDCAAEFRGRMSYHPLVRVFAKVKGMDLIRTVNGRIESDSAGAGACPGQTVGQIAGAARVDAMMLSGFLRLDGDSVGFGGPSWMAGDTSYHSVLSAERGGRRLVLTVSMYER